jgi:hypothetical protein
MTRGQLTKVGISIPKTKEEATARLLLGQTILLFIKEDNEWIPCFLKMRELGLNFISNSTFKIPTYSEFVVWKFVYGVDVGGVNYAYRPSEVFGRRVICYPISINQCRQLNIY